MPDTHSIPAAPHARLTYLVKRLELAVRSHLDVITASVGLTTPQYAALSVLKDHAGISAAALARRSFVSTQAMNEMVSSLERKLFVRRDPSPDHRRVLRIFMTEEGERTLQACDAAVDEVEATMIAALEQGQTELLRAALQRCYSALAADESAAR